MTRRRLPIRLAERATPLGRTLALCQIARHSRREPVLGPRHPRWLPWWLPLLAVASCVLLGGLA